MIKLTKRFGFAALVVAIAALAAMLPSVFKPSVVQAPAGRPAADSGGTAGAGATAVAPAHQGGVPILMYHSIGWEKGNDAVISPERFAEHMAFLHDNGYVPISLDELDQYLRGARQLPAKAVVITFDDGYRDTYEIAMPILKRYNFRATLFVPVAEVTKRLTWDELREMKAAGMAIASHSYRHRDLGGLPPEVQAEEIRRAKVILDKELGQDTKYFCYPNGSYDAATLKILREQGYRLAFTIEPGWAKPGDDPLRLKRIWMGNSVNTFHLKERLTREDYPIL